MLLLFHMRGNCICNNNNNGTSSGEGICRHSPGACNTNILPLYAQDRPCVMKNHILQEVVALLINRTGGGRGVNKKKDSLVQGVHYCAKRLQTHQRSKWSVSTVEGKKPRRVNFEKWWPSVSSILTVVAGAIPQWIEDIPSYSWDKDGD